MIRKFAVLLAIVALSGCATVYKYDGQTYSTKEELNAAVDAQVSRVLATITPLPAPLTRRKLTFAMPSLALLNEMGWKEFSAQQGKEPSQQQKIVGSNLNQTIYTNIKIFSDAINKKNIYTSTQFMEMDSGSVSFPASTDTDTLVMSYPAPGAIQWYYTSLKNGKQIFAADRSSPTAEGKVQAFVDAVQVQAIRD